MSAEFLLCTSVGSARAGEVKVNPNHQEATTTKKQNNMEHSETDKNKNKNKTGEQQVGRYVSRHIQCSACLWLQKKALSHDI